MIAVFVNTATVLAGSLIGILFRSRLRQSLLDSLIRALGLCTILIAVSSALETNALLCVIFCMALGTLLGELLNIDRAIEHAGDAIKARLPVLGSDGANFTDGFVSACVLFCIGSMTIVGSLEAGIRHDYSIIYAKSLMDFVSSMAFGAAMGFGVTCSAAFVLVFQGALTLLAGLVGSALSDAIVTEMSAIGGVIMIGLALNLIGCTRERIKVANMLPAIFLPLLYFPIVGLFGA